MAPKLPISNFKRVSSHSTGIGSANWAVLEKKGPGFFCMDINLLIPNSTYLYPPSRSYRDIFNLTHCSLVLSDLSPSSKKKRSIELTFQLDNENSTAN